MNRKNVLSFIILLLSILIISGCRNNDGIMTFRANGEDFVKAGFVSKDGWNITFENIYLSLSDIIAYQTAPPYNPHSEEEIFSNNKILLNDNFIVDLAEGEENAIPVFVGEVNNVPVGHYNAISWQVNPEISGNSLVLIGIAEKNSEAIHFTININQIYEYRCGEFVGDVRKGFFDSDNKADLEMTFHFDHIFGDNGTPLDDDLNQMAVGFEPFAKIATDGVLEVSLIELKNDFSEEIYQKFLSSLLTLGHVGEGHCFSIAY